MFVNARLFYSAINPCASLCLSSGPGKCREGTDAVWPAADEEALPADVHPNPGGTKVSCFSSCIYIYTYVKTISTVTVFEKELHEF